MRLHLALAACSFLALAGCSSGSSVYGVVVEDAVLSAAPDANGWCGDRTTPAITVTVQSRGAQGVTSSLVDPAGPAWNELVMASSYGDVRGGLRVDVEAQCSGKTVHLGAAHFAPPEGAFAGETVLLRDVGAASELRLHLVHLVPASSGGSGGYYVDGYYYEDDPYYYDDSGYGYGGDYGGDGATCYDDGTCVGDDGTDWSDDSGGDWTDQWSDDSSDPPPDDPPPDDSGL